MPVRSRPYSTTQRAEGHASHQARSLRFVGRAQCCILCDDDAVYFGRGQDLIRRMVDGQEQVRTEAVIRRQPKSP